MQRRWLQQRAPLAVALRHCHPSTLTDSRWRVRQVSLRTELKFASLYVGGYPVRIERIVLVDDLPS